MSTHTPGPFRTEVPPSSSGFGRAIYAIREDSEDVFVAYVGNWKQPPAVENADAALFAAAPDMLAALKVMVEQMESTGAWEDALNGQDEYLTNAVKSAHGAIARAEGREG